jgi:hypothetical protein
MTSFRFLERQVFPELYGIVLVSPGVLERIVGPSPGDLLTAFSTSEIGDTVCRVGAAVPVIGLTGEYHDVLVRDAPPSLLRDRTRTSPGWVLRVEDAPLVLCGLGWLGSWKPDHPQHRRISVPPGFYQVEIAGGVVGGPPQAPETWGIEFVLSRGPGDPKYSADPMDEFGMYFD